MLLVHCSSVQSSSGITRPLQIANLCKSARTWTRVLRKAKAGHALRRGHWIDAEAVVCKLIPNLDEFGSHPWKSHISVAMFPAFVLAKRKQLIPFVSFCILSWFCIQALLICKTSSSHSICCAASTTVACNFTLIPAITPPSDPTPTLGATASPAPFKARINVQILTSIVSWTSGKRCPILW